MDTDIIVSIAAIVVGFVQMFDDTKFDDDGGLVLDSLKLVGKWVTYFKLFVNAYSGLNTKGSEMFGFVFLLGFLLNSYVITNHININHKAWARTSISGMAILSAIGCFLLKMVIPEDHAWHNTAVEMVRIFFLFLEASLLVHSKINEAGDNQNFLRDLIIKFADTLITSYRFVDSKGKTHCPWDAEKILHMVGAGLPMLIGTCQICWILYKADIVPKVAELLRKIPRVFARKTEQAAGATMGSNGGRDAGDQVADERVEAGNGLPVKIEASQVGSIAGMKFQVIKWLRQTSRVSAGEEERAGPAGVAMENYGSGEPGQQAADEDVQVVVASRA